MSKKPRMSDFKFNMIIYGSVICFLIVTMSILSYFYGKERAKGYCQESARELLFMEYDFNYDGAIKMVSEDEHEIPGIHFFTKVVTNVHEAAIGDKIYQVETRAQSIDEGKSWTCLKTELVNVSDKK